MEILNTTETLNVELKKQRALGKTIGFVPTMGALHKGHISLIKSALIECDVVVCSIFVNPLQFDNKQDLENYPTTLEEDIKQLTTNNCTYVFVPEYNEVFRNKTEINVDFGVLSEQMEAAQRIGHFEGVAAVVNQLFKIVSPDVAYFGEKDYQQLSIVRLLVRKLGIKVLIRGVATVREKNGLAMSSRNLRLTNDEREKASVLFEVLRGSASWKKEFEVQKVKEKASERINELMQLEYFEIVEEETFVSVSNWQMAVKPRAFVAAYISGVRLIDNYALY